MKNRYYIYWFMFLTAVYVGFAVFAPIDPTILQKYHISEARALMLTLTVVVPIVMIWLVALYGLVRFKEYTEVIQEGKEGLAFRDISNGLLYLAFSLPIGGVIGSFVSYLALRHPHLIEEVTIVRNYARMIVPGIGLILLARGASGLTRLLKKSKQNELPHYSLLWAIILTSFFSWLITAKAGSTGGNIIYFLPNWLILLTLVVPYTYTWCRGLFGVFHLLQYRKNVKGVVYKKSLNLLAMGVSMIIILSVLTQLITTLSARLNRLNLTPLLLIVYVLVALNALGYGWVARGARKLKQIEEV